MILEAVTALNRTIVSGIGSSGSAPDVPLIREDIRLLLVQILINDIGAGAEDETAVKQYLDTTLGREVNDAVDFVISITSSLCKPYSMRPGSLAAARLLMDTNTVSADAVKFFSASTALCSGPGCVDGSHSRKNSTLSLGYSDRLTTLEDIIIAIRRDNTSLISDVRRNIVQRLQNLHFRGSFESVLSDAVASQLLSMDFAATASDAVYYDGSITQSEHLAKAVIKRGEMFEHDGYRYSLSDSLDLYRTTRSIRDQALSRLEFIFTSRPV